MHGVAGNVHFSGSYGKFTGKAQTHHRIWLHHFWLIYTGNEISTEQRYATAMLTARRARTQPRYRLIDE